MTETVPQSPAPKEIDRSQVISDLHETGIEWLELELGFRDGEPLVNRFQWGGSGFPESLLKKDQIELVISFLKQYLTICPDDTEIAHRNGRRCDHPTCPECYERERSYRIGMYFPFDYQVGRTPKPGFVVMIGVSGGQRLFASKNPERRFRELEREYAEPITLIHKVETNDQEYTKWIWNSQFVDYYVPKAGRFELPDKLVSLFRSRRTHDVQRREPWEDKIRGIDLADPQNLPLLLSHHK